MNTRRLPINPVYSLLLISFTFISLTGCMNTQEKQTQLLINHHVAKFDPLYADMGRAYYTAQVTGAESDYDKVEKLELEINNLYLDRDNFELIKELKDSGQVTELRLARQLQRLYLAFLTSQMDPDLLKESIKLQNSITEKYNNYRGSIDGEKVTMTEIYRIMTTEKDVALREKAWRASKEVGPAIVDDYLRLVQMRNQLAQQAGFPNYHTYLLTVGEQSVEDLDKLFAELDNLTVGPFKALKAELDEILAKDYGIGVAELRPWHYHDPFFQRTPLVYELNLDQYYAKSNVGQLCIDYYAGIGTPVDDIMARSDLYDKPGKNPHAFAQDIDRHGDVRILANIANDERWMETMLHELGHAVYSKYHDPAEPYLLREQAHPFTTEAVAMFFGRLSRNAAWMQTMLKLTDDQRNELEAVASKYLRFQQILFARWALVMYNFEKAVYADPQQDLNTLWWDLVEKYQLVTRPAGKPDAGWASKLHFTFAPCYYHNYMLGELLASQWHHYIINNVLKLDSDKDFDYCNNPRIGKYFIKNVYGPGALYHWNEMIRRSTGEELTAKYFVDQFVN